MRMLKFSLQAIAFAIFSLGMVVLLLTPRQVVTSFTTLGAFSGTFALGSPQTTILIANSGSTVNDVTEVNRAGQIIWQLVGLESPVDAERLPSGNTLIAEAGRNRVIEVTPEGEIVWGVLVDSPYSARRLPSGNILITSSASPSAILEVTREAAVVWSFDFSKSCESANGARFCRGVPRDAIRLVNGNTLVAFDDAAVGLVEIDPDGAIVSEKKVTNEEGTGLRVYSAQQVPSGDWLVTASGLTTARIVRLAPTGAQMWFYGPLGFCDGCLYLPRDSVATAGGTVLIADYGKDRILEVDADGKIVWRYERPGSGPWSVREVPGESSTTSAVGEKVHLR